MVGLIGSLRLNIPFLLIQLELNWRISDDLAFLQRLDWLFIRLFSPQAVTIPVLASSWMFNTYELTRMLYGLSLLLAR